MKPIRILLFVALAATAFPCAAGTNVQTKGTATLEVRFEGDEKSLSLADLIHVTVTVEGSPALRQPIAPLELPSSAPWILVSRSKDKRETIALDRVRWSLSYQFAPRQPGRIPFAFPEVKYRDGDSAEQVVAWRPIDFTVTTQIARPDPASIRDITEIETLPALVPTDASWLWWTALGAAALLLISLLLVLWRLRQRTSERTPAEIALEEWRRLIARKLPEQGRSERFVTLLTMLVRRFLERQFALPARRRTTPEFLRSLADLTTLTTEEKQFLTRFLQRSEVVKFAHVEMPSEECREWALATRAFLQGRANSAGREK